jgi:sugar diacid utilization regulator
MRVTCGELLNIPSLKKLKLVAGIKGLERIVRWVHVLDIPYDKRWIQGNELIFITGVGLHNYEEELYDILISAYRDNLAGLVINIGPYIKKIPARVLEVADYNNMPVFELPWKYKLVDVIREICVHLSIKQINEISVNKLVESIIFERTTQKDNILELLNFYGYNLSKSSCVIVVQIHCKKNQSGTFNLFMNTAISTFSFCFKKPLYTFKNDKVIFIVSEEELIDCSMIQGAINKIYNIMKVSNPGIHISAGIGRKKPPGELNKSFREANFALELAKSIFPDENIKYFKDLGFYRLLFSVNDHSELKEYSNDILGILIEYDNNHNSALIKTLECYLLENGDLKKVSEHLHIHYNTAQYRLRKISEISGRNTNNLMDCMYFLSALVMNRYAELFPPD